MIISNKVIKPSKHKSKIRRILKKFNKVFVYLLIADLFIIFLSMSFGFRIIFAPLYRPTFYLTGIVLLISIIGNYSVIIKELIKRPISTIKKIFLIISSLFYPIGVFTFHDLEQSKKTEE